MKFLYDEENHENDNVNTFSSSKKLKVFGTILLFSLSILFLHCFIARTTLANMYQGKLNNNSLSHLDTGKLQKNVTLTRFINQTVLEKQKKSGKGNLAIPELIKILDPKIIKFKLLNNFLEDNTKNGETIFELDGEKKETLVQELVEHFEDNLKYEESVDIVDDFYDV